MPRDAAPPVVNLVRAMLKLRTMRGRELAIFGTAWLDAAVELNLRYNMRHHAGRDPDRQVFARGLRGLESRLWVAEAFGLFGTSGIRAQADLVRRVRNEFAHTIEDVDCDSPTIAPLIDQMTLSTNDVSDGLFHSTGDPEAVELWEFEFDGETFQGNEVSAIGDENPDRVLFFVPISAATKTREDRLRRQIHAAVYGVLGLGLKPWLEETENDGIVDLTGWQERAAQRDREQ